MIKIFGYLFSKRKTTMFFIDVFVVSASAFLSTILLLGANNGLEYFRINLLSFILMVSTFLLLFYIADIYNYSKIEYGMEKVVMIILASLLSLPISALLIYLFNLVMIGRKIFILHGIMVIAGVVLLRKILTYLTDQSVFKIRAAAIGLDNWSVLTLQNIIKEKNLGIKIIKVKFNDYKELETLIKEHRIEQIITSAGNLSDNLIYSLSSLILKGIKIMDIPQFFQEYLHKIPVEFISNNWLYNELKKKKPYASYVQNVKQIMDIALAAIGFIISLPLYIPIALSIKLTSKGPVFYTQKRIGKNGKSFTALKFRSMIDNAEQKTGAVWAKENDDRITFAGRFLRESKLDELPQLINVLKGEMSLIGPRPEREEFITHFINDFTLLKNGRNENYLDIIPYYAIRLLVKPGITGWAQVNIGYVNSSDGTKEKLEYELYYILNQSIMLDLSILFKTISIILLGKGI